MILAIIIVVVLCAMLVYAGHRIESLSRQHEEQQDINHAMCIAHLAHYVGNSFAAEVLKAAAEDYSSAEGQHELKVIVQSGQYVEGGLTVPSLWMVNRARALRDEVQS
jgi:hypothetical protein